MENSNSVSKILERETVTVSSRYCSGSTVYKNTVLVALFVGTIAVDLTRSFSIEGRTVSEVPCLHNEVKAGDLNPDQQVGEEGDADGGGADIESSSGNSLEKLVPLINISTTEINKPIRS